MSDKYILDRNNQAVPCDDIYQWGGWFEKASLDGRRIVAKTNLGAAEVSTVFLGVDHNFNNWGNEQPEPPLLFETMIFGTIIELDDGRQWRCSTWAEAVEQHERVVKMLSVALASS